MSSQNVRVARDAYDAFARQDIPGVLAAFDPDVEFKPPDAIPHGGLCRGHDEMVAFLQSLTETFEELRVEPDEFLDTQDRVIVLGTHRGSANGRSFETPFAHVWTMRDGRAVHWKEYIDPSQILSAVGWQAPASVAAA